MVQLNLRFQKTAILGSHVPGKSVFCESILGFGQGKTVWVNLFTGLQGKVSGLIAKFDF
jgi:hypothetical protein